MKEPSAQRRDTGAVLLRLSSGLRLFFDVEGTGWIPNGPRLLRRPTAVLLHGAEVDHSLFRPWVSPLAEAALLVYMDLAGHGRSDQGSPRDWSLEAWADQVAELAELVGLERPVVLGFSLGGRVAMTYALRHPERLQALVLVNTTGAPRPDRRIEMMRRLGGERAAQIAEADLTYPGAAADEYRREVLPFMVQRRYSADELARFPPVSEPVYERLGELYRDGADLLGQLSAIECPTLVLTGALDPAATPDDAADLAGAIGANATLEVVAEAGHGVFRDQPNEFNDIVARFVAGLA
jgi:proline iminopeptidase